MTIPFHARWGLAMVSGSRLAMLAPPLRDRRIRGFPMMGILARNGIFALALASAPFATHGEEGAMEATSAGVPGSHGSSFSASTNPGFTPLPDLVTEALEFSPEIRGALQQLDAARQRVSPSEALDDPVLEAGVINVPLASSPFGRDDMTMKMIGLSQRLPFPGKLGLRREVAAQDAEAVMYASEETRNRVARDVRIAYFDLGLTLEMIRLTERNKLILEELLHIAEDHYEVGRGNQADVLKAQTQVSRMTDDLLRLARERPAMESELLRALGRNGDAVPPVPAPPQLNERTLNLKSLRENALAHRPQLAALRSLVARNNKEMELARRNYYPDFDIRMAYGQRDSMLDNTTRADMVSLTVALNLPVWRDKKLAPREAEAAAMRDNAESLYQAQRNEIAARLRQEVAMAEQSLKAARLYQTTILPQARLAVESSLIAYRVDRVDFMTLLDSQMTVFNYEISLVTASASYNKALAEIDLLIGRAPGMRLDARLDSTPAEARGEGR